MEEELLIHLTILDTTLGHINNLQVMLIITRSDGRILMVLLGVMEVWLVPYGTGVEILFRPRPGPVLMIILHHPSLGIF
jgi:hypothetical protein